MGPTFIRRTISLSRYTTNFTTFFTIVELAGLDWCTIIVISVVVPCESIVALITICHIKCEQKIVKFVVCSIVSRQHPTDLKKSNTSHAHSSLTLHPISTLLQMEYVQFELEELIERKESYYFPQI